MVRIFRRKPKRSRQGGQFAPNPAHDPPPVRDLRLQRRRPRRAERQFKATPLSRQDHPGLCDLGRPDVVGEGNRQAALRRVLAAEGRDVSVLLLPEPDNVYDRNAVKVMALIGEGPVEPVHVGYLPREDAAAWSPRLNRLPTAVYLDAKLAGGTDDKPSIGVFINDPEFVPPAAPPPPAPAKTPRRHDPAKPPRRRDPNKPTVDEMLTAWHSGSEAERLALWDRLDDIRRGRLLRRLNDWPYAMDPSDIEDDDLLDYTVEHDLDDESEILYDWDADKQRPKSYPGRRELVKRLTAQIIAEDLAEGRAASEFVSVVAFLDAAGRADQVTAAAADLQRKTTTVQGCLEEVEEIRALVAERSGQPSSTAICPTES